MVLGIQNFLRGSLVLTRVTLVNRVLIITIIYFFFYEKYVQNFSETFPKSINVTYMIIFTY